MSCQAIAQLGFLKVAAPRLRVKLLGEALTLLDKARGMAPRAFDGEKPLAILAGVRAEVGTALPPKERRAAFYEAAMDYLRSEREKSLRSNEQRSASIPHETTPLDDPPRENEMLARALLQLAARKAPGDKRVWAAHGLAAGRGQYGDVSKEKNTWQ